MNSLSAECQELKTSYDTCFNQWYTDKFLKGEVEDNSCAKLFSKYQECVKKALEKLNINIPAIQEDIEKKPEQEKD